MNNIPNIFKKPLPDHSLNFLLSSFLISPKKGFINVAEAYIDHITGSSLGNSVISEKAINCPLLGNNAKAFPVIEMESNGENRKLSGGTKWCSLKIDRTSGDPNYNGELVTKSLARSVRRFVNSALVSAIYAPVVATRNGVEKLITYADDSQETVDFSKKPLGYKELSIGIDSIIFNRLDIRDGYFLFLPSSIWKLVYKSHLEAPTSSPLQYKKGMWQTKLGVNIIPVPDKFIPVENGLFKSPFINRRALGAVIRRPEFDIPYGFSDILEYNRQRSENVESFIDRVGGMPNVPFMFYGSNSVERLGNDSAIAIAFDFIAGRISGDGVYTFTFSAKNQKGSPAPVYYTLPPTVVGGPTTDAAPTNDLNSKQLEFDLTFSAKNQKEHPAPVSYTLPPTVVGGPTADAAPTNDLNSKQYKQLKFDLTS